jgi:hypothetical protein
MVDAALPMATCARCAGTGFVGPGGLTARRGEHVCPACESDRARKAMRRGFVLCGAAVVLQIAVGPDGPAWALAWVGLLATTVVGHELGHALVAAVLRFDVRMIRIGVPAVVRFRAGRTRVEIGPFPFGGFTVATTRRRRAYRLRRMLVVVGGPAANALVAALAWRYPGAVPGPIGAGTVVVLQAIVVLENLWPRRVATPEGEARSDGSLLWELMRMGPAQLEAAAASEALTDAVCRHVHGIGGAGEPAAAAAETAGGAPGTPGPEAGREAEPVPADGTVALRLAQTAYLTGDGDRAVELYAAALGDPQLGPHERALACNDLAWVLAGERRDAARFADADALSAEAFALMGWHPAVRNTRGAVLVLTGRAADGVALLAPTVDGIPTVASKARCLAILVEGHLALGNLFEARKALHRALVLRVTLPELDRVRDAFVAAAGAAGVPVGLGSERRAEVAAR